MEREKWKFKLELIKYNYWRRRREVTMIFSVARRYRAILIIIILHRTIVVVVVVRCQDDYSSQKERVKEANISERLLLCVQYKKNYGVCHFLLVVHEGSTKL